MYTNSFSFTVFLALFLFSQFGGSGPISEARSETGRSVGVQPYVLVETPTATPTLAPIPTIPSETPTPNGGELVFPLGNGETRSLDISPDGNLLLVAGREDGADLFDTRTGATVQRFLQANFSLGSARFSRDGGYVFLVGNTNLTMIELATSKKVFELNVAAGAAVAEALEQGIFAYGGRGGAGIMGGSLHVWNSSNGELLQRISTLPQGTKIYYLDLSPDGKRLLAGTNNNTFLLERETQTVLFQGGAEFATMSRDGRYFYSSETLFDAQTGQSITSYSLGYNYPIYYGNRYVKAAFSFDGLQVAVVTHEFYEESGGTGRKFNRHEIQLFDTLSGTRLRRSGWIEGPSYAVCFSPDGSKLYIAEGIGEPYFLKSGFVRQYNVEQLKREPTPSPTPSPSNTPLPTATSTPIPNVSKAWQTISQSMGQNENLPSGYDNPYRLMLAADEQGKLTLAWSNIASNNQDYAFARQWDGERWTFLGSNPVSQQSVRGDTSRLNWLLIDPSDNLPLLTMDHYINLFGKFNGQIWRGWNEGGIDDSDGLEKFTQPVYLPDGTLAAFYLCHSGYGQTYVRARKFVDGQWIEFSPGSSQGNGISDSSGEAYVIYASVAKNGEVYALWEQVYGDRNGLYIKKWDGQSWVEVGEGSAREYGIAPEGAWISLRPMILDDQDRPIVAYGTQENFIRAQRFDGQRWIEIGIGSNRDYGIADPGHRGVLPTLIKDHWGRPVAIWQDLGPLFPSAPWPLYAKRFNGSYWEPAGEGAASGNGIDLVEGIHNVCWASYDAVNGPDGEIYVAYSGIEPQRDILVKKLPPEAPVQNPTPTPVFTPEATPVWFVLDGFGGIHSSSSTATRPRLPYFFPFNIVRDLEPDPMGQGWYMLDGFGGIHTDPADLPRPTNLPYFYGFDIARNLEVKIGENGEREFYMLDGFGTVHTSKGTFDYGALPWFGFDIARNLEYNDKQQAWMISDGFGLAYSNRRHDVGYVQYPAWNEPLVRGFVLHADESIAAVDAFGGRHTSSFFPAKDIMNGVPDDFYFPGFDIIWDVELVPEMH